MGDGFQKLPWTPKSVHAQVFHIKWARSIHTISPLHPWVPNHEWKTIQVFMGENPHVSESTQLKPVLFKG